MRADSVFLGLGLLVVWEAEDNGAAFVGWFGVVQVYAGV